MIADWLIRWALRRAPDFQIGGAENPYCNRWWLIPRNRWFNVYLHQFVRDDDDRALHDHPWPNCSMLLRGAYSEVVFLWRPKAGHDLPPRIEYQRRPGRPVFRRPSAAHRVVLSRDERHQPIPCWSLFLTGPVIRSWGFWTKSGWVHWKDFCDPDDPRLPRAELK